MAEEAEALDNDGSNEAEYSPAEAKARSNGWSPEEEWRGDKADWVDYTMFNLKGEFMGRINEQSSIIAHLTNKVEDRDQVIGDMSSLQDQISEREYKKALKDLTASKKDALEENDFDRVVDVDEQISELKENKPAPRQVEQQPPQDDSVPREIVEWLGKPEQSWYHTNATLRGMAEGIAGVVQGENPTITPSDLITEVNSRIRKEVPQYFQEASSVDGGGEFSNNSQSRRGSKLPGWNSLNE